MPPVRRLTIATKLLAWTCALIVVFFSIAAYLFQEVRSNAETINRIVEVNHKVDSSIQRMLERLYSVQDNIRRFKRIGNEEAVNFIVEDLDRFGAILAKTLEQHPRYREEWQELTKEYELVLTPPADDKGEIEPDATVREWVDILEQSMIENQADIDASLARLQASGERATTIGLYGLLACLLLAVGGSLVLAWTLNRSLTEVRNGIRQLGTGSSPKDVRILSGDELGELAEAFNRMAGRLRQEETMRADFIAMLSHEIRTPLTSIREAVDLIESGTFGEVNEKQRRFLGIAGQETLRLTDLLTRLMTVSRMESQTISLALEEVDGNVLAASTLERLEPAAGAKPVRLESDLPDAPSPCRCDPGHIQQVLLNLVGNAIKFTPEGGTVTIAVRQGDKGTTFSVTDDGPGIPEEDREQVFRKYYRAPGVRESVDGAGLGLSIARRIVEAHGAVIELDSEPGRGSTFRFTLPFTTDKE